MWWLDTPIARAPSKKAAPRSSDTERWGALSSSKTAQSPTGLDLHQGQGEEPWASPVMMGEHELQSPRCWKVGLAWGEALGLVARLSQHRANMCCSCSSPGTGWHGVGAAGGQGRRAQGGSCVLLIFAFFNALLQISEMLVLCCGNQVLL